MFTISKRFSSEDIQKVYDIICSISNYNWGTLQVKNISQLEEIFLQMRCLSENFIIEENDNGEIIKFTFKKDGLDSGVQLEIYIYTDDELIIQIKSLFSSEYVSTNTSKIIDVINLFDMCYSDN